MSNTPATARLELKLILIAGAPRQEYEIRPPENTIGRGNESTITIDDPLVSRLHCKIVKRGTAWVLVDLGSENKTFLNGKPLRESVLSDADQIHIGRTTFFFSVAGAAPPNEEIEIIPPQSAKPVTAVPTPVIPMHAAKPRRTPHRSTASTHIVKSRPRPKPARMGRGAIAVAILVPLVATGAWFSLRSGPFSPSRSGGSSAGPVTNTLEARTRGLEREPTDEDALAPLYSDRWAVVIGIDRYPNLGRREQLQYAVSDAQAIERVLRDDLGFERVETLYNQDATKNDILAALDTDLGRAGPDDAVFVFFAGHGHTEATAYGDVGYVLPHDGSFDSGEMYRNISMTELSELSKRIRAKHVFFAMDSCYSGQLLSRTRGSDSVERGLTYERLQSLTSRRVRQVLTAGGKGEVVLDGGPFGHSVFTGRLVEALQGSADLDEDGFITVAELELYVGDKVFEDARRRGKQQNPQFGKLFSGEGMFVFERSPPASSPEC